MALKSDRHPCVTLALIASMPRVFEAIQDKCITKANCKKDSKQFYVGKCFAGNRCRFVNIDLSFQIKYCFSCLQCPAVQKSGTTGLLKPTPLPALNVRKSAPVVLLALNNMYKYNYTQTHRHLPLIMYMIVQNENVIVLLRCLFIFRLQILL